MIVNCLLGASQDQGSVRNMKTNARVQMADLQYKYRCIAEVFTFSSDMYGMLERLNGSDRMLTA